ncbi:uncharacterized protein LOC108925603 isoform X2 [Scleropages formosus]|nr:uncharacterized protein LOC108925603 isoform X2 [Scleropages formosus]
MSRQEKQAVDLKGYEHTPLGQQPAEHGLESTVHQHLHRLFGPETAEYFLNPALVKTRASPWLLQWMAQVGEQVSGQVLWNTLRRNSNARLLKMETGCPKVAREAENIAGVDAHKHERSHLHHLSRVRCMFQTAQLNQAKTTRLLAENPLPQLSDRWEWGGPHGYLPQMRDMQETSARDVQRFKHGKLT